MSTMSSEKLEGWRPLEGIRAVSVYQLLNARTRASDGNKFEIADGIPIMDFTIVAQVLSVVVSPFKSPNESKTTTYTLQDGSGVDNQHTIKCLHTQHSGSPRLEFWYGYARVVGTLLPPKRMPRNTIRVIHITPIVDVHEIYSHLLEVMSSAHTFAQGVPPPMRIDTPASPGEIVPHALPPKASEATHFAVAIPEPSTFATLPSKRHSNTHYPDSFNSGAIIVNAEAGPSGIAKLDVGGCDESRISTTASPCKEDDDERLPEHRKDPYDHLSSLQRNIMLHLLNSSKIGGTYGDGGVHIQRVVHGIGRSARAIEIENALDFLTDYGYIKTKDGGNTYYVVGLGDVCYTNLSLE